MENRTIRKTITINAPKEQVWEAMMQDKYYQEWTAAFSEGSKVETDWELGSKAVFTDKSGGGIVARVVEKEPYKRLAWSLKDWCMRARKITKAKKPGR
ncbi:activator of Hsp90 ATPase-like protein [Pontibacter mucosus]|uniref:Activator of Hsp90 ATPase-like protein n=1 Tax=Pontibacter mucosus TaxID=1649266 RepID=A0A2T5YG13_9BACT|nr:SRPBCC domain-containing protein [Pontibacter mucosus]PTX18267.1 activator of Hsp90 ATPase-like protein [Pontibacter mucosus]